MNWQRALLVVARDALPALVENDDQPNLATLVDTLKRHLGDGGRGPVDEELTTLYRAASAHLKTGARAYAETVGADRRPILLGDVLIGRKYDVPAPLRRSVVGAATRSGRWCSSRAAETTPARRRSQAGPAAWASPGPGADRDAAGARERSAARSASAAALAGALSLHAPRRARVHVHRRGPGGPLRAGASRSIRRTTARRPSTRAGPAACSGFEQRLAEERQPGAGRGAAGARRLGRRTGWPTTQPARVMHPMAVEAVRGQRPRQLRRRRSRGTSCASSSSPARIGQRQMSCADQFSGHQRRLHAHDLGRAAARWFLLDKDFSPFVGTAFSSTSAPLKIVHFDPMNRPSDFLKGNGRAHSLSASRRAAAGHQLRCA